MLSFFQKFYMIVMFGFTVPYKNPSLTYQKTMAERWMDVTLSPGTFHQNTTHHIGESRNVRGGSGVGEGGSSPLSRNSKEVKGEERKEEESRERRKEKIDVISYRQDIC